MPEEPKKLCRNPLFDRYDERRFGTIIYNIEMTYIQARGQPVEVGILLELQEQPEVQLELEAWMPLEVRCVSGVFTRAPRS